MQEDTDKFTRFHRAYDGEMEKANSLDFDDLLLKG